MADLVNVGPGTVPAARKARFSSTAVSAAFTIDTAVYDTYHVVLGANSLAITVSNVRAGECKDLTLILEQDGTGTRLKPTLAGTNDAGTTLVFHTSGTGGGNGALPTLTTTAGAVDVIRFTTPDGVNFYQTSLSLNDDE